MFARNSIFFKRYINAHLSLKFTVAVVSKNYKCLNGHRSLSIEGSFLNDQKGTNRLWSQNFFNLCS